MTQKFAYNWNTKFISINNYKTKWFIHLETNKLKDQFTFLAKSHLRHYVNTSTLDLKKIKYLSGILANCNSKFDDVIAGQNLFQTFWKIFQFAGANQNAETVA